MMSASPLSPDPPVGFSLVRGAVGVGLDLRLLACRTGEPHSRCPEEKRPHRVTAATGDCPETAIWLPGGGHERCPLAVMGSARHEIRLPRRVPRLGDSTSAERNLGGRANCPDGRGR